MIVDGKHALVKNDETNKYEVVTIGDYVGFKADIEQYGEIVNIEGSGKNAVLYLVDEDGFPGDYLRYDKETSMEARRCWI